MTVMMMILWIRLIGWIQRVVVRLSLDEWMRVDERSKMR